VFILYVKSLRLRELIEYQTVTEMTTKKGDKEQVKEEAQPTTEKLPCKCGHVEGSHGEKGCGNKTCKCKKYRAARKPVKRSKAKGKSKPRKSRKQCMELGTLICKKYAEGLDTIESVCKNYGVEYATFYNWTTKDRAGEIREIRDLYKNARENAEVNYGVALKNRAKESLLRKVTYTEVEETHTEQKVDANGKPTTSSIKKVKKTLPPSDNALIFALTNTDPKNFKNKPNGPLLTTSGL